jgi:zeaxanthin glucosyltransferase
VPLICLPLGNDQPGVAARVAACGAGLVIARRKLNFKRRLRAAVRAVLEDTKYRIAARTMQAAIRQVDGLERAADIVEQALEIGASSRTAA